MEFNYDNNYSTLTGYTVVNGNLYYKYNDEVIRRDSKTGEETVIFDIAKEKEEDKETADVWWLYGDGEYLYLDNYNDNKKKQLETLLVLNTEGEKIDKLPYGGRFYGADEKYIYFDIPGDDIVAYYDKTQLGKGTFETKSLLTEDSETGNVIECNEP